MTGIWDERPEPVWVPRGYFSTSKIKDDDIQMLNLEETDVWLDKLQEEHNELDGDAFVYFSILNEVKEHIKIYPDEKDPKYSGSRPNPSTGHTIWNMPYFLTDLETWFKGLNEIIEKFQSATPKAIK